MKLVQMEKTGKQSAGLINQAPTTKMGLMNQTPTIINYPSKGGFDKSSLTNLFKVGLMNQTPTFIWRIKMVGLINQAPTTKMGLMNQTPTIINYPSKGGFDKSSPYNNKSYNQRRA